MPKPIIPAITYNDPEFDGKHYPVTDFMERSLVAFCEIMKIKGDAPKFYYFVTVHGVIFTYDSEDPVTNIQLNPTTMVELVNRIENLRYVSFDKDGNLNLALDL